MPHNISSEQSPQVAYRTANTWYTSDQVHWESWDISPNALTQMVTLAKTWQQAYPDAVIVGAISYEQAALHHGLLAQPRGTGAVLGLIHAQDLQQHHALPPYTGPQHFSLTKPLTPILSQQEFTAHLDQLISELKQYPDQQANLAQLFAGEYAGSTWHAWRQLMARHPAPHACFLRTPTIDILSASPELLLHVKNNQVSAEPIKGSRPRGTTDSADDALAHDLTHSHKDLVENRMITALQQAELEPLCNPGSVSVKKDCELRRYSNVQHLVSTVSGTLKPNTHPLNALINCMPGASITGTPKHWAITTIAELEPQPRNFYCGSFFRLYKDEFVSNVLIRTMQAHNGIINCYGGGGITALSNSKEEYEESCFKVAPLFSVWADHNNAR